MNVTAINFNRNYFANMSQQRNPNFKGVLVTVSSSSDYYEYKGSPSSYNGNGHYMGYDGSDNCIYYPFKDESEAEIRKALDDNNYSRFYDPESTGGYSCTDARSTTLGKRLPYTKREWNRMSEKTQDKIISILKS